MKALVALAMILFSYQSMAKTVARVLEIKGNAFVFYGKKVSERLSYGYKIQDMSEVMVDDSSVISVKDEYGRIFHLAGGSYVKFFNNMLEVKNGNIWVSSKKADAFGVINSVNSIAKYNQGQFIYSFDNMSGKSQVLVLTGDVNFSNVVESNLSVDVPAGHFSFVDQKTADGLPRGATQVGLTSYKKMKSLFSPLEGLEQKSFDKALFGREIHMKREIASVPADSSVSGKKKGKIIFIESGKSQSQRRPASASGSEKDQAYNYYKGIRKNKKSKKVKKSKNTAKVRMFGFDLTSKVDPPAKSAPRTNNGQKIVKKPMNKALVAEKQKLLSDLKQKDKKKSRAPASVEKHQLIEDIQASGAFESSLQKAIQSNKRHPKEVNELIDELESYDQSFQKNY